MYYFGMLWDKNRDLPSCHVQGTGGRGQLRLSTRLNKPRAASILLDTAKIRPAYFWVPFVSLAVKSINHSVNGVSEFLETVERFLISLYFSHLSVRVSSVQICLLGSDRPAMAPKKPVKGTKPNKGAFALLCLILSEPAAVVMMRSLLRPVKVHPVRICWGN